MGYLNLNKGYLQKFKVQIENENGYDILYVTIWTDVNSVKYRISTDERHPDLQQIKNDFIQGLTIAKTTDSSIDIEEYLERMYIFVNFPNASDNNQYTARKIQI